MNEQEIKKAKEENTAIDAAIVLLIAKERELAPGDILTLAAILERYGCTVFLPGDQYPDDGEYKLAGK